MKPNNFFMPSMSIDPNTLTTPNSSPSVLTAPKGKTRVLEVDLLDSEEHASLVGDYNTPKEAIKVADDYNESRAGWGKDYVCRVYNDQGKRIHK